MEIQNENYFKEKDLLSVEEIIDIAVENNGPNRKAFILKEKLLKYCFISCGTIYVFNTVTVTYRTEMNASQTVNLLVSKLLEQSVKNLDRKLVDLINNVDRKRKFFKNSEIKQYAIQLESYLTKNDITCDVYLDEMHFLNGYVKLTDGKLYPRKRGKHYVTKYIPYDYDTKLITEKIEKKVKSDIKKVYTNKEDLKAVMWKFGRALTGRSTDDQGIMCTFGTGSSGKTTLLKAIRVVMPPYVKLLKEDALAYSATNIDKIMNTFMQEPQVRFAAVDDPKDTKISDSVIKNIANGEINTIMLYKEGSHTVKIFCMLIIIMNTLLQTKIDTGIVRRLKDGI